MSCYLNGDLVTYRLKSRTYTAVVRGDHSPEASEISVWGQKLGGDTVPVETILMHQPSMFVSVGSAWGEGEDTNAA